MERATRTRTRRLAAALALAAGTAAVAAPPSDSAVAASVRTVDSYTPSFSHPLRFTNALFPVSALDQTVSLGHEGDTRLRVETTRLERTRVFNWNGLRIRTAAVQFVGYADGQIAEVATDYFAQDDRGAIWYFGEDVTNYEDGRVLDHDGTWHAGIDGPPGLIMPANPRVGDVYHPENIPGFVFEEDTVVAVGLELPGPTGRVTGAIRIRERLLDGTLETKVYAPGYGEFIAEVPSSDEYVEMAVAVPTDHADDDGDGDGDEDGVPPALDRVGDLAESLSDRAEAAPWRQLRPLARDLRTAAGNLPDDVVPLLLDQLEDLVDDVDASIRERDRTALTEAALNLELAALDMELRYADVEEVDEDRVEVWGELREHHLDEGDRAAARSDGVIIATIGQRLDS